MQSSDQQPTGEPGRESGEVGDEREQASSPLYEFPADSSLLQDAPSSAQFASENPGGVSPNQPSQASFEQGLVYPPPPSFYQNMQVPPGVQPNFPPQWAAHRPAAFPPPGTQGQFYPGGAPIPPYPPGQFPGMQAPGKRSYKWVWIIVSILIAGLLLSGGLCIWAFYSLFNTASQQVTSSINVVNDYFQHIENKSYENAYRDLQISGLTQSDFIAKVQASDTQYGPVISFRVEGPSFSSSSNPSSGSNLSQWRYTVDVTRVKTSYPVLLTVQQIGGSWEITYIDRY